jgi:hypothetical protein
MRLSIATVLAAAGIAAAGASLSAKGETSKITISGADLSAPIVMTDEAVLKQFNVWSGAGTSGTVNGVSWTSTEGFIVDWSAGFVAEPPELPRYEVAFHSNVTNRFDSGPTYIVFYAHDLATGSGYVYLPGRGDPQFRRNVFAIFREVEGHWFYATRAWHDAVAAVLPPTRKN